MWAAWLGSASALAEEPILHISQAQLAASGIEVAALAAAGAGALQLPAQVAIPNDQVHVVSAPIPATVQTLFVAPGDAVRKGQRVARLGGAQVLEAQREYLQAASQAQLAARSAQRDEQLFREGIIAEARHQATRAAHVQAAALLAEKRQALRLAGLSDKDIAALASGKGFSGTLEIVAPADGVILEQGVTVGQRVDAAAMLYRLARLAPLWLEIQMPMVVAAQLKTGAAVRVAGSPASGRLIAIGRQVNAASQTVAARAEITEGAEALRPGQFVEASLDLPPPPAGTWRLPQSALVRERDRVYVFVRVPQGFRPLAVKWTGQAGESALVAAPFKGDERIAVKGVAALKAAWMGIGKSE